MDSNDVQPLRAAIRQALRPTVHAVRPRVAVSTLTLLALSATAFTPPASAADYSAATEAELYARVEDANDDLDPTATITLTADITLTSTTAFEALTKPITIDTNGFTLSAQSGINPGGALTFAGNSVSVTGAGTLRGGNASDGTVNLVGGSGLALSSGSLVNSASLVGGNGGAWTNGAAAGSGGQGGAGAAVTNGSITNTGTMTGGTGGDTNGTSGSGGAGGAGASVSNGSITNEGTITGGVGGDKTAGIDGGSGGAGGSGVVVTSGSLTNNGTITGGHGSDNTSGLGPGGDGGTGATLSGGIHINNATIHGGIGGETSVSPGARSGGTGASLTNAELTNNGLIEGGQIFGGVNGGIGLRLAGTSVLTNNGTVRAGSADTPISGGGVRAGIMVGSGSASSSVIRNSGTIEGGLSGEAIYVLPFGGPYSLTVINSGTIRAGADEVNAIAFGSATSTNALEIHAGSVIQGNVVASAGANDTFRLGGTADASFDVSAIGASAQYRGFDIFQKDGASTWTLTGTTSAVTPWQLNSGTLSVASDENLGGAAGGLTFNGGTLQNTAAFSSARAINILGTGTLQADADLTLSGTISGSTTLIKTGAATLTRTGTGAPATWNLLGGTLSVSSVGQMGTFNTSFDGGTLRVTAPVTYTRSAILNAGGGTFRTDADLILTNTVTGAGSLTKTGPATLVLGGTFGLWTGGTTITEGTLQIGNGGLFGALPGNVLNNATLAFDKTTALTVGGLISGSGAVIQRGTGTTTLTGDNTYTGATTVQSGTLRINGDQSAATGSVNVASGAALGGSGIIGGAVNVAAGGHLAPGNSPGTLTMGSLTLSGGSVLDFELGEANAVNSALNDLINVNGDLTLDGTLNVSLSVGGTYGAGIYRLINYTGTLTDNGLDLGLMPASSSNYVQTSVANQVNLINTQGLVLNYWDGAASARNDGQIGGGGGVWQAAGNDNWATADAAINADYQDGAMVIFGGTAGTVTVDDGFGPISVSGLQFASDGYRVEGDAIELSTGLNSVRVGDGSDDGAGFTATIASALTGTGTLDKTDLGTLVLTGENSYTGGTTISAGTLQLGDGGTSGSLAGDITNDATLVANRSDTLTLDGVITGTGAFRQEGTGTTVLAGAGSTVNTLYVERGSLEVASGASVAANTMTIASGASLRNAGTFSGTAGDDTLTLAGTLIGSVGLLDGNDTVEIADGATFSEATLDGGAGVDTLDLTYGSAFTLPQTLATGFEHLVKRGAGDFTLAGNVDAFSESMTIAAGRLHLDDASVQTNELRIGPDAIVTGTGSLSGGLMNAGALSPGNSPGAIHVAGNYTQSADGVLISEITQAGTDLLDVAGTASLAGTHQINVEYGMYLDGTTHTLIQAAGGISGDFDTVQFNPSALITADRELSSNALTVSFARQPITTVVDPNSPRGRFAAWLEDQIAGGTLTPDMNEYVDMLLQQSTAQGASSLLRERGEPVASLSQNSVSILGAGFARTVFDRFTLGDSVLCAPAQQGSSDALNCFWGNGLRQWGQTGGDSRYDWTSNGGQIGVDRSLSSGLAVGGTFGYADTGTDDSSGGVNDARTKMGGVYASYASGPLSVGATAFYSANDNSTRRSVLVGSTRQQARADFDTDSYGAGVRLSYRLTSEDGPLVRPYIEALYDHIDAAAISERDAGSGNLNARVHDRNGLRGTLGLQLAETFEAYGRVFRPSLEVGVAHQFEDDRSTIDLQPFGGAASFRTYGPALDRTAYVARTSLNVSLGANASIALGYGGEIAEDYSQHEGNLSLRVSW